ncbi:hypothetical protein O181_094879 [Austropuccinia psidii MF-1]|uniref:DUF4939 domain-containing protein n=1 Tax=Austropuccinia psidii MF-1 TaxID=1389203 RepID=A0A9Q3J411_9BASI|nr:hypothetical protein [Austropuccinia psidii MF-1]
MQQMTQIMANFQAASRPPAFKASSMNEPEWFDGTQPFNVRSFIQSCQFIFHNDLENFSEDRKKFLYATSFLIGRTAKWIEPYLSKLTNQDTNYLPNSWEKPEKVLITFNADHKDYYDPSNSLRNDLSFSKSCAALVSDSRTPSFPSSVHIPSLNSHMSLLSSRDEVFREIHNVGEDDSVSSLHLFFGDVDLPPSSYHDSLEE